MAAPVLFLGLPQSAPVDLRIGLDTAAAELSARLRERPDLDVGPLTWEDVADDYDTPLATGREAIQQPYSIGVEIHRGTEGGSTRSVRRRVGRPQVLQGFVSDDAVDRVRGYDDCPDVPKLREGRRRVP